MVRDNAIRADAASDRGGETVDTTAVVKDVGKEKDDEGDDAAAAKDPTMPSKRRSQANPPPPLTQKAFDQLVRYGIEAAIRVERERVREEPNRAGGLVAREYDFDEFCPIEEVHRLEDKLRHLKLKDMNIAAYTKRFNELALLCPNAVPNEKKKVELYIKRLPDIIKGETTSSRPATLNEAVRMAHTLMKQKIKAKNESIAEGIKRKWENNNQGGSNNCNNNNNRNNNDNRNNNNHNNRGNYH
ncbi:hypothetical protein Tco_1558626, partial [Tanacetum coccineum]